jgi:hypothetical protein
MSAKSFDDSPMDDVQLDPSPTSSTSSSSGSSSSSSSSSSEQYLPVDLPTIRANRLCPFYADQNGPLVAPTSFTLVASIHPAVLPFLSFFLLILT